MPTVLDTISDVEDKVVDAIATVQEPVIDVVRRVAEYVSSVVPEDRPSLPYADQLPTATDLVESQFAFAQKLLDLQHQFAKALVDAAGPLLATQPISKPKAAVKKTTAAA